MKRMHRVFGDLDALRYVDGHLDADRTAAFLAHLADDAVETARVATWSRQAETIRGAFAGVMVEPVPVSLRLANIAPPRPNPSLAGDGHKTANARIIAPRAADHGHAEGAPVAYLKAKRPAARGRGRMHRLSLSAALLLATGLMIVYVAHALLPASQTAGENAAGASAGIPIATALTATRRASDAYATYALDPVHAAEFGAAQMLPLSHWAQRRLGLAIVPADLRAEGWTMLGGRMVPGNDGPGVFFVYEDAGGERLSIFAARAEDFPPPSVTLEMVDKHGSVVAMSWVSGPLVYVLTVGRSVDWLARNGEALRAQIARTASP